MTLFVVFLVGLSELRVQKNSHKGHEAYTKYATLHDFKVATLLFYYFAIPFSLIAQGIYF